jgi:hypothetical protein
MNGRIRKSNLPTSERELRRTDQDSALLISLSTSVVVNAIVLNRP